MKPLIKSPLKIRNSGRNIDATGNQAAGIHKRKEDLRRERNAGGRRKDLIEKASKRKHQWLWFIGLWCGGLAVAFLLASFIRWMMRIS